MALSSTLLLPTLQLHTFVAETIHTNIKCFVPMVSEEKPPKNVIRSLVTGSLMWNVVIDLDFEISGPDPTLHFLVLPIV